MITKDWQRQSRALPRSPTAGSAYFRPRRMRKAPSKAASSFGSIAPIHIHDIFFQVISRKDADGNPVERQPGDWGSGNLAWKDVFVVPPFGSVTIVRKFTDNKGRYVFHCHNLIRCCRRPRRRR